jgi:branched-chain amino acid transport system substrate-binding protein
MFERLLVIVFLLCGLVQPPVQAAEPIRLAVVEAVSGPTANAGEAVLRNLRFAVERVNERGGVVLADGRHPLELKLYDNKGQVDEALAVFKAATDDKAQFILQGNSSAVAGALIEAVNRHNERAPTERVLFLNYSAIDPALTNEKCSFWHFRFDAHADMRMQALTEALRQDGSVKRVYLLNQDYSFGQSVARAARAQLQAKRSDIEIVGEELHPMGRIKDFAPYVAKIVAAKADAVITGNWGNDLTLLVKAAREGGFTGKFYTFFGNALGAPAAIGEAGVDRVLAVAEWHANAGVPGMERIYLDFRKRYPAAKDDYLNARNITMIEMLVAALEKAGSADAVLVARALEGMRYNAQPHPVQMRGEDHQLLSPLYVFRMSRAGGPIKYDVEGSGFGFATERQLAADQVALPGTCKMQRP